MLCYFGKAINDCLCSAFMLARNVFLCLCIIDVVPKLIMHFNRISGMTNAVNVDEFDVAFPSKDIGVDSKTLVFDILSKDDVSWANDGFIKIG